MHKVWLLFRREMYLFRYGFLFTAFFFLAYGFITSALMDEAINGEGSSNYIIDIFYIVVLQIAGIGFRFNFSNLWHSNPYLRRIRFMRKLPVRALDLVLARYMQLFVCNMTSIVLFLFSSYLVSPDFQDLLTTGGFILFVFLIFLYSFAMSTYYVYFEMGHSAKVYFVASIVTSIVITALVIQFELIFNVHLVTGLMNRIANGMNVLVPVLSFLIIAAFTFAAIRLTTNRLERRDYY